MGLGAELLLRKIPNDYRYKRTYLDSNSNKIKVLFLGNSHFYYGINPEFITSTAFNAAHISQSLNYDFEILKKYENKLDSLKYIVVPVDYFSLFTTLEKSVEAWRVKNYTLYYGINITNNLADHTEILSNNFKTNALRLYNFYLKHVSNITCTKLGWGTSYNSKNNQDLVFTGKLAAKRHFTKSQAYFDKNVGILKSIIEFSLARNIHLVFITSPAYKTYVQNLNNNQLNQTVNSVTNLTQHYNNTQYINLLNDNTFNEIDFYDADHLNEIGAKKLTIKIDSLLTNKDHQISSGALSPK